MVKLTGQMKNPGLLGASRERYFAVGLFILVTFLAFYNLDYAPRTWHDEGAALSVSKTLVTDGVYAVRTSQGYQTFGPIQSVGPTVLLPVALSFKLNGIGLVQGRIVAAGYLLLAMVVFYVLGRRLFGWQAAYLSVLFLLGSYVANFFYYGRQALGEVPAFAFLLSGWLVWSHGQHARRYWLYMLAGLLFGAAAITKSTYVFTIFGMLGLAAILDLFYYRQGNILALFMAGLVALACIAAWQGWQFLYFGRETFQENATKMRELAAGAGGFDLPSAMSALRALLGPFWNHFYYWWGWAALPYIAILSLRRHPNSLVLVSLLNFTLLWLLYYFAFGLAWPSYIFAPAATSALFVGKLWYDLASKLFETGSSFGSEIRLHKLDVIGLKLAVVITMGLMLFYPLQYTIRAQVLDRDQSPQKLAVFLNETVDQNSVIETWDRELDILTDHSYHFPDQSFLSRTHAASYHNGSRDFALGADYFNSVRPAYVVVGPYSRRSSIYNMDFLRQHSELVAQ